MPVDLASSRCCTSPQFFITITLVCIRRILARFFPMERPCLVLQNVGTDLLDFDVQEPHHDIDSDDDGEPMKETLVEEAQGEQPEGRLRTQKGEKEDLSAVVHLPSQSLMMFRKTRPSAHVVFLDSSTLDLALASTRRKLFRRTIWPSSLDSEYAHSESSIELYEYELAKKRRKPQTLSCGVSVE